MVQKTWREMLLTFGRKYKRLAFQQQTITLWPLKRSRGHFKCKVCASSARWNLTNTLGMQLTRCRDGERAAIRRLTTRIMSFAASAALQEGNWLTYSDKTLHATAQRNTFKPISSLETTSTAYQNEWTKGDMVAINDHINQRRANQILGY